MTAAQGQTILNACKAVQDGATQDAEVSRIVDPFVEQLTTLLKLRSFNVAETVDTYTVTAPA